MFIATGHFGIRPKRLLSCQRTCAIVVCEKERLLCNFQPTGAGVATRRAGLHPLLTLVLCLPFNMDGTMMTLQLHCFFFLHRLIIANVVGS